MENYVGEIRMFAGNYAPQGWALCDGSVLAISQYEALFALIGTTYGGDGRTNFALPDLRGRIPIGLNTATSASPQIPLGATGGSETVALTTPNLPAHSHTMTATSAPADTTSLDNGATWATTEKTNYMNVTNPVSSPTLVNMNATTTTSVGNGQAHDNMMPSVCINFIIATNGFFPTSN